MGSNKESNQYNQPIQKKETTWIRATTFSIAKLEY